MFKQTALLFLAATTVLGQASTIVSDLQNIQAKTEALTSVLKGFNPGKSGAAISAVQAVKAAIAQATSDTQSLGTVSDSDQVSIINAAETLYPAIIDSLDTYTQVKFGALAGTARGFINQIKSSAAGLGDALVAKATGQYKTAATTINNAIQAAFTSAIAGNAPQSMSLPSVTAGGSSPSNTGSPATTSATGGSMPMSSAPSYQSSSVVTPVSPSPVATPPPASYTPGTIAPAPQYTGAAAKIAGNAGAAVALAAVAFAL